MRNSSGLSFSPLRGCLFFRPLAGSVSPSYAAPVVLRPFISWHRSCARDPRRTPTLLRSRFLLLKGSGPVLLEVASGFVLSSCRPLFSSSRCSDLSGPSPPIRWFRAFLRSSYGVQVFLTLPSLASRSYGVKSSSYGVKSLQETGPENCSRHPPAGIFLLAPTRKCFQRRIRLENWRSGVFHLAPDFIRKSGAS